MVGTGLAVIGSLYLLLATDMADEEKHEDTKSDNSPDERVVERCARCNQRAVSDESTEPGPGSRWSFHGHGEQPSPTMTPAATEPSKSIDPGRRRQVARFLNMASERFAAKAHTHIEGSGFNAQRRTSFPVVPGENLRNMYLLDTKRAYSKSPIPGSRAGSSVNSFHSDLSNGESNRQLPWTPPPTHLKPRQKHANSLPSRGSSSEIPRFRDFGFSYGNPSARQESTREVSIPPKQHASGAPSAAEIIPAPSAPDGQGIPPKIVISSCVGEAN